MNTLPTETIANRLMVEVHYYTPSQFCLMTEDTSWENMFYCWENGYHSTMDTNRNATWGVGSDVEKHLGYIKTKYVEKGIPGLPLSLPNIFIRSDALGWMIPLMG